MQRGCNYVRILANQGLLNRSAAAELGLAKRGSQPDEDTHPSNDTGFSQSTLFPGSPAWLMIRCNEDPYPLTALLHLWQTGTIRPIFFRQPLLTPLDARPRCAYYGVSHNHKQIRPLLLRKALYGAHDGTVDLQAIRLAKADDKNAVVLR